MSDLVVENRDRKLDKPGGVLERLDASRREVVQLCGEKGMALFTFLLSSSMLMPGQEDMATFSPKSLSNVALQLGWSPDTVKRYVAVFRATNLLQHYHDHRREVRLHIPLGPYIPLTNFTALDELIGRRKKQQQLARSFKTRYIVRFGDPTQTHSDETRAELDALKAILDDEHLEPLKRQRLQIKIADLLTHFAEKAENSRVGDPNNVLDEGKAVQEREPPSTGQDSGDPNGVQEVLCSAKPSRCGDLEGQQGDPLQQHPISSPLGPELQGDQNCHQEDPTHSHIVHTEVLSSTQEVPQGDPNQKLGDSLLLSHAQQPLATNPLGDSDSLVVQRSGDPHQQVTEGDLLTYNVNSLINDIPTDNAKRKQVAEFLGKVLEDDANTFRKYLKLFTQYKPEVIGRAFLCTMVLMHREHWSIHRPGGFFTSQCWALSGQTDLNGYTLEEVEEWLSAFGDLSYGDLLSALTAAPTPKPASVSLHQTGSASGVKKSDPSSFGANHIVARKKRTYGMHFTGLPSERRGFNTTGSLTPPAEKREYCRAK
jgi:hypothetical protein